MKIVEAKKTADEYEEKTKQLSEELKHLKNQTK